MELNRSFSELPSSIIWEILGRLPIKTCLTCKLVCKDWYQIIICPKFSDFRRSNRSCFTLLFLSNERFVLLELDKASEVDEWGHLRVGVDAKISFKLNLDIPYNSIRMVGHCSGFVGLMSSERRSHYYICNLLTGQCLIIERFREASFLLSGFALGRCSLSHQLKVLRCCETKEKYMAEIQTLGSGEWRSIVDAPFLRSKPGSYLNGSFHWYSYEANNIWSFRFGDEQFSPIPLPDNISSYRFIELGVFDSCLCLCCSSRNGLQNDIWLMTEYGVKDSWVKLFVIPRKVMAAIHVPLLRMGKGKILMSHSCRNGLACYDPESGAFRKVNFDELSNFKVAPCDANFCRL